MAFFKCGEVDFGETGTSGIPISRTPCWAIVLGAAARSRWEGLGFQLFSVLFVTPPSQCLPELPDSLHTSHQYATLWATQHAYLDGGLSLITNLAASSFPIKLNKIALLNILLIHFSFMVPPPQSLTLYLLKLLCSGSLSCGLCKDRLAYSEVHGRCSKLFAE